MPVIKIPQLCKNIEVTDGTNLMAALIENEVPVASSCDGDGVCGKCVIKVSFESSESLPRSPRETVLQEKHSWNEFQRASCQIVVHSNLIVQSSYW